MPCSVEQYRAQLAQARWLSAKQATSMPSPLSDWLWSVDSLSQRLSQHCDQFSVELIQQRELSAGELTENERELLGDSPCIERQVLLLGDGQPWVFAQSLLPLSTLTGEEQDLAILGNQALGFRVFRHPLARRDAIQVASLSQGLWARRSRLWIADKPLLVHDLFLPQAPLY
ncbi:chorismate lyase [Vibrio stylophorae]|nr:chorismate lyase [Vibrio stylophorae]